MGAALPRSSSLGRAGPALALASGHGTAAFVSRLRTLAGRWARPIAILSLSTLAALLGVELLLRLAFFHSLAPDFGGPLRALRTPHPTRGWTLVPNGATLHETLDYRVKLETNSRGLRDVEHALAKPPGVFRIVVLGDSFMEAYQVELEASLPRLLERELGERSPPRVEVINLGIGGYGTAQQYLYLREEGLRYEPDLVVLGFFLLNDLRDNHRGLEERLELVTRTLYRTVGRPFATLAPETLSLQWQPPDMEALTRWISKRKGDHETSLRDVSVVARLLEGVQRRSIVHAGGRRAGSETRGAGSGERRPGKRVPGELDPPDHDPNVWLGPLIANFDPALGRGDLESADYERMWREAWDVTAQLLFETRALAAERGAAFCMFLVPSAIEVESQVAATLRARFPSLSFDLDRSRERIARVAEESSIPLLDLAPAFRASTAAGEGPLYHQREDTHWNASGHRLAARELARFLEREVLLPPR